MSASSRGEVTVSHNSKLTVALLLVIIAAVASVAWRSAAWCERIEARVEAIENRIAAYETWPRIQK